MWPLRPHATAIYRRGPARRHRSRFSRHRSTAKNFRSHVGQAGVRRIRAVELGIYHEAERREFPFRCIAGVSVTRIPSWLHHDQQALRHSDAKGSRGQTHRGAAVHDDRSDLDARASDYGVDLSTVHWVEGSINSPTGHGEPTVLPMLREVPITRNRSGKSLSQLLDEGEIDAILGTTLPDARRHNPDIVRLFPNFREVEKNYYKRTGIFPIMHVIAIKRTTYEKNPFIAQSLYHAFCESKQVALAKMRNVAALRYMLPWITDDLDELDAVFGDDPWPYGVEANRTTLATMMKYMVEQGLLKAELPVDELFLPVACHKL
jgi:hypothetical protein